MSSSQRTKWFKRWLISGLAVVFVFASLTGTANARRWAVGENKKLIEAELVDYNGHQILLRTNNDRMLTVDLKDLGSDDLQFLTHMVQLRQQEIARQQLQQQQFQNLSRYFDLWAVELIAPNGQRIETSYLARNNQHAVNRALNDYPYAQVGYTRRVRRSNQAF